MSIENIPPLVYTALNDHTGIQALVGNGDSPETFRVFNQVAEQDLEKPYVTYQVLYDTPYNSLSSADGDGTIAVSIQVSSYSDVESEAYALAKQVKYAMRDAAAYRSVYVFSHPAYEKDTKLFSVITEYSVMKK